MKKILTMLVLAVLSASNAFALSYTERLNVAFQTLADAGINPTIMESSLENVQVFSNGTDDYPSVDFTVVNSYAVEAWIPVIVENLLNSVVYQGDVSLSGYAIQTGSDSSTYHDYGVNFTTAGQVLSDSEKLDNGFHIRQKGALYNLEYNGQSAKQCYRINSGSHKRCIKAGLNYTYSKTTSTTAGVFRTDSRLWTNGFGNGALSLISGSLGNSADEIKVGMQSQAWLTASSILGQTVNQICEPGVITPICNIVGQKFEQFNTKVQNAPLDVEAYNAELDNILLLSGVASDLDQLNTEWYAGDNGELTFGHVNWGSIIQP